MKKTNSTAKKIITIRNVSAEEKKSIILGLEYSIKSYGLMKTKAVVNHYFKSLSEKVKAQKRIEELKQEIHKLEKKQ